jgi:hypothetical protein
MSKLTSAKAEEVKRVTLTRTERERLTDSRLKIQSVAKSLKQVDPKKIPDLEEIEKCLDDANKSFTGALQAGKSQQ